MKRIYLISTSILFSLYAFAQRGRVRPEDLGYNDNDYGTSSSDGSPVFPLVILIIMIVGIIWFKIALSNSRSKEILEKTIFLVNRTNYAYTTAYAAQQNKNIEYKGEEYFIEQDGKVAIPKSAKCIILEYSPDNRSYVKVKFEEYPEPLFIARWRLKTPAEIKKDFEDRIKKIQKETDKELKEYSNYQNI